MVHNSTLAIYVLIDGKSLEKMYFSMGFFLNWINLIGQK